MPLLDLYHAFYLQGQSKGEVIADTLIVAAETLHHVLRKKAGWPTETIVRGIRLASLQPCLAEWGIRRRRIGSGESNETLIDASFDRDQAAASPLPTPAVPAATARSFFDFASIKVIT